VHIKPKYNVIIFRSCLYVASYSEIYFAAKAHAVSSVIRHIYKKQKIL
jgi:hypothetical protein